MNHLGPRQRHDGRWDYAYNNVPWGYCRAYKPIPEDDSFVPAHLAKQENEKMVAVLGNFHADGHATELEACACYKRFLLDTKLRLMQLEPENASQQNRCQVCKKFTACYATVGPYRMFTLCLDHQTRVEVEKLLHVDESWES